MRPGRVAQRIRSAPPLPTATTGGAPPGRPDARSTEGHTVRSMSPHDAHTILVLGGIKSGKSEFAESLAAGDGEGATVRYVATSPLPDDNTDDTDWAARIEAHRRRRPAHWTTEDIGAVPDRLAAVIGEADAGTTVLVDDLGGWFTALLGHTATPAAAP